MDTLYMLTESYMNACTALRMEIGSILMEHGGRIEDTEDKTYYVLTLSDEDGNTKNARIKAVGNGVDELEVEDIDGIIWLCDNEHIYWVSLFIQEILK